jgi:hypothetical protein
MAEEEERREVRRVVSVRPSVSTTILAFHSENKGRRSCSCCRGEKLAEANLFSHKEGGVGIV